LACFVDWPTRDNRQPREDMTRFKELRRIERAVENLDATGLEWSAQYCRLSLSFIRTKQGGAYVASPCKAGRRRAQADQIEIETSNSPASRSRQSQRLARTLRIGVTQRRSTGTQVGAASFAHADSREGALIRRLEVTLRRTELPRFRGSGCGASDSRISA